MTRPSTHLPALALVCLAIVSGTVSLANDEQAVADLSARMQVGEFAEVAAEAERLVAEIEGEVGRYHSTLGDPLTVLGDARLRQGDSEGALQAYDRAKHIVRLNDGVQGLAQLPLLYREAEAFVALGDRASANERHEFAYSLKARVYGKDDPRLVPGIKQLIDWYLTNYKFRAAQVLYEQLMDIVEEHYPPGDRRKIEVLRGYADTYRQRRFGVREPGRGGFSAWPPGYSKDPPWYRRSSYRRGKQALRDVLDLTRETTGISDIEVAAAMVELADWNLLHYEHGIAMSYYRRAWALLEADDAARADVFEKPTALYLRLPQDPAQVSEYQGTPQDGVVQLALTVTHRGDVVGRKTLRAEPHNLMEFRLRKAAKLARYRPAFQDGNPVARRDLRLEFRYKYYAGDVNLAR